MNLRFAPIILLLGITCVPAHAEYRVCASNQLTTADNKALRKVIARVAGEREVLWPSMFACVNRDAASTNVQLKYESQPDGSRFDFNMSCERGRTKWICDLGHVRNARVEMDIEGRLTTFKLRLPEAFDLRRVKPLLVRASEVGSKTTVKQQCEYRPQGPDNPRAAEWLLTNHDAFRFSEPVIAGEIEERDGMISLIMGVEELQFAPDPDDGSKFAFRCWTFQIIVT